MAKSHEQLNRETVTMNKQAVLELVQEAAHMLAHSNRHGHNEMEEISAKLDTLADAIEYGKLDITETKPLYHMARVEILLGGFFTDEESYEYLVTMLRAAKENNPRFVEWRLDDSQVYPEPHTGNGWELPKAKKRRDVNVTEDGAEAFRIGAELKDNPFAKGTNEHFTWRDEWLEAKGYGE